MKCLMSIVFLSLWLPSPSLSQTPSLSLCLESQKEEYVLGEPFEIRLTWINPGHTSITIGYDTVIANPLLSLHADGPVRSECAQGKENVDWMGIVTRSVNPGEVRRLAFERLYLGIANAGIYQITATYDATGQTADWYKAGVERIKVTSNTLRIRIISPTGLDAEVFKVHKNSCNQIALTEGDTLRKYPTSTYAAYVIKGILSGFMEWEPTERNRSVFLGALETGSFLSNSYPDDTGLSKDGWRWLKGEEAAKWWDKWTKIILKNHPDIWFADELRLRRALNYIALKKYDAGAADLKTLARDAKEPVASSAKLILNLIKEKGWIKSEAAAPEKAAPSSPSTPAPMKPSGGGS